MTPEYHQNKICFRKAELPVMKNECIEEDICSLARGVSRDEGREVVTHQSYERMPEGASDILFMLFCHTVNTWLVFSLALSLSVTSPL